MFVFLWISSDDVSICLYWCVSIFRLCVSFVLIVLDCFVDMIIVLRLCVICFDVLS